MTFRSTLQINGTKRATRLMSLSVISSLLSTSAFPQAPTIAPAETDLIEEIVVTARKVEESVQHIPMSVQVLSQDFLDKADLTRLFELQFNVPGLVVNDQGMFGAGFSLRGIADYGGSSLSVAAHLNGVYLGTSNLALARMFDLERVEVLKGPQGTLYGRNATGGSLNFVTRAPEDEFRAQMEAAYGSFDTARAEGYINIPFKKSAFRLAFTGSEGDGYIHNSVDDRKFAESDFWGVRASFQANPSDKLQLSLMAQHVRDDGASGELWGRRRDSLPDPDDIWLTTVTLPNPYLVSENDNVSAVIEYDLGFADLHSITGYAHSSVNNLDDCAGSPPFSGCARGVDPLTYEQWSEEIQFISKADDSLDWLIGINFFSGKESEHFLLSFGPIVVNDAYSTAEETAYAGFGQVSWRIAPLWSVTGGLRLSHDKYRISTVGSGLGDSQELAQAGDSGNHVSWRFDVEYAARENVLAYAGVSTGYKSGGFSTTVLPHGELDDYEPEDLTAFETGVKAQSADHRLTLNASAFYYDFRNLQVVTQGVVTVVDNAAKAEIYGLDLDGFFALSDELTLSAGLVWLPKREFVEFTTDENLAGNKVSRAPEWSGTTALSYALPWRGSDEFTLRLEYNYRSSYFFTKENRVFASQEGFGLVNMFLRFEAASARWYVFAAGRNLANEPYVNQAFIQTAPGYPANYEVGFGLRY